MDGQLFEIHGNVFQLDPVAHCDSDAIFGNITGDSSLSITDDQIGFSVIPAGESGVSTPFYATVDACPIPTFKIFMAARLPTFLAPEKRSSACRRRAFAIPFC